jgi:hypothetical protein
MCVKYHGKSSSPVYFSVKEKQRILLRMNSMDNPAIHLEVNANDFDGYKLIFGDYQNSDAPLLIVDALINQSICFAQKDHLYIFSFLKSYF